MACDLIDKLLRLDPLKRLDTDFALKHYCFWTDPEPCSLEKKVCSNILDLKKEKKKAKSATTSWWHLQKSDSFNCTDLLHISDVTNYL